MESLLLMRSWRLSVLVSIAICAVAVALRSTVAADNLPQGDSAAEAVTQVYAVKSMRPVNRATFKPIRRYFSSSFCRKIDKLLNAFERMNARRDQIAQQAGIAEAWWWPPEVDIDVHLLLKDDPLTDRAGVPDRLTIGKPRQVGNRMEIMVTEDYFETGGDGTNLGGTKTCDVIFVPENNKWVIDDVRFTTDQYGRRTTATLGQIVQSKTYQAGKLEHRMKNFKRDVRPAMPITR
jgi:hypothetical protein